MWTAFNLQCFLVQKNARISITAPFWIYSNIDLVCQLLKKRTKIEDSNRAIDTSLCAAITCNEANEWGYKERMRGMKSVIEMLWYLKKRKKTNWRDICIIYVLQPNLADYHIFKIFWNIGRAVFIDAQWINISYYNSL